MMALGWRVSEGLGEPATTEPARLPKRGRPLGWPPGLACSLGDTEDTVGESTITGPMPLMVSVLSLIVVSSSMALSCSICSGASVVGGGT